MIKLKILTEEDLHRIHEATLDILESTGVWFNDSDEAIELFKKNGCTVDGYRVRIDRQVTDDCIKSLPDRDNLKLCNVMLGFSEPVSLKQGDVHIGLIGNPYYLHEHKKGARNLVESDVADKFRVLDRLENFEFDFCCCLVESSRQAGAVFADYNNTDICLEYLRRRVAGRSAGANKKLPIHANILHGGEANPRVQAPGAFRPLEKMEVLRHAIICGAAQTLALLAEDTPLVWCNPVSPLQYHAEQVREIMQSIDAFGESCFVMISPEVMNGATGPVTLAGALAQQNAEVLAGVVLTQLCAPGTAVIYGSVGGAFDMKAGEISHGNFETSVHNAASSELADFYGLPSRVTQGITSARETGVRAAAETAGGLLTAMASGGNLVSTGLMDSTVMLSYEHMVLVNELVNQYRQFHVNTDTEHIARDVIQENAPPDHNFLSSGHTLEFMKESVYYSDFTGRSPASQEDWYDIAHEKVKEILAHTHDDDEEVRTLAGRLASVEARLNEDEATWREGKDCWWESYIQDI